MDRFLRRVLDVVAGGSYMRAMGAFAAVLLLAGAAEAADLKVPKTYETIQAAVDAAAADDTITVSKGTYRENVLVQTRGLRLVGKQAVIDGTVGTTDGVCLTVLAEGVTIQGFTFRNGAGHVVATGNALIVTKCVFIDPEGDAVAASGEGVRITSNQFRGAGGLAVSVTGAGALLQKNQVSQTADRGLSVEGDDAEVLGNTVRTTRRSTGIRVSGLRATVQKNTVTGAGGDGILVSGATAVVEANKVSWTDAGAGIRVDGADATISRNRILGTAGGIRATGDGASVLSNVVEQAFLSPGMRVVGDGITVTGNTIKVVVAAPGLEIRSATAAGQGLVEKNRVEDAGSTGLLMSGIFQVAIRANSAIRCGTRDEDGFLVQGDGNTLEDDSATDCDNTGFRVDGTGNTATKCSSAGCTGNGFKVTGADNSFVNCSAKGSGDGFDNGGTGTVIEKGVFRGNRLDIANRVSAGATLSLVDVDHDSGDATTEPEVD